MSFHKKVAMNFDVTIIGAGPSGLCFAQMLADSGLSIAILDRQSEDVLSEPKFDGREIAITHHSVKLLSDYGIWQCIDKNLVSPLRDAKVINGKSSSYMFLDHRETVKNELGYLISNFHIRKSAYDAVKSSSNITLIANCEISGLRTSSDRATVTLTNGKVIQSQLLVGADNRFSESRRLMGISSNMHDFGKTMMVCEMEHEIDHQQTAWEWFDYGQTLALLPMIGNRSSVVITLSSQEIKRLMELPEFEFNREVMQLFKNRLGEMQLKSTCHAYPLVTVYSDRFIAKRFALIGDAAVGMHPVTAHGFNFALRGAECLASEIKNARKFNHDIASDSLLETFQKVHRRVTRPLFIATFAIAKIYTNDKFPTRLIRDASIHIGNKFFPFKRAITNILTADK
jgi:ubiquinone biosynthesis UbiH/UbiF/VisC/COQ6 family hydroxylase